jgi:hypothetical protein
MPAAGQSKPGLGKCTACRHRERGRLDYLLALGDQVKPLAAKFKLTPSALYNHKKKHISAEYVRAVRIGPLESEEQLRDLCTRHGGSVIENLTAIYAGLVARWLAAFEGGDDQTLSALTHRLHKNLELRARLTHELMPPAANVTNNVLIADPQYLRVIGRLAQLLAPFPEARKRVAVGLREMDLAHPQLEVPAITALAND